MIRLTYQELEEDLQAIRSSKSVAPAAMRSLELVTLEVMLVRQIALLDDVLASRAARGASSPADDAPILERRLQAARKLLRLRGALVDVHDYSVVALPGSKSPDYSVLPRQLTEAGLKVTDAEDESRCGTRWAQHVYGLCSVVLP
jgi:hypothetical protein